MVGGTIAADRPDKQRKTQEFSHLAGASGLQPGL
jgi:hypothetical protein